MLNTFSVCSLWNSVNGNDFSLQQKRSCNKGDACQINEQCICEGINMECLPIGAEGICVEA